MAASPSSSVVPRIRLQRAHGPGQRGGRVWRVCGMTLLVCRRYDGWGLTPARWAGPHSASGDIDQAEYDRLHNRLRDLNLHGTFPTRRDALAALALARFEHGPELAA
jgi:hypothetical protein